MSCFDRQAVCSLITADSRYVQLLQLDISLRIPTAGAIVSEYSRQTVVVEQPWGSCNASIFHQTCWVNCTI